MKNPLDYITVGGFRSIRRIEKLKLGAINVLVGANGSGKSNLIETFSFLHAIHAGRLVDYADRRGGADNILHFGAAHSAQVEIEISFAGGMNGYRISLAPTNEDRFAVQEEVCWFWDKDKYPSPYESHLLGSPGEAGISRPARDGIAEWVQRRLGSWRIYHFQDTSATSPMKKTADVDDNKFFRPDGSNLAPYLLLLKSTHPEDYQLIRRTIQRVTPFFHDFELAPLRSNERKIRLEWTHKGSEKYFDASSLSDGTLRFICLATLFLQPPGYRPSLILIDEPELGLHPYAITLLSDLIKSAAAHTQVLVSTQSPLLLDHFAPEDVLVSDRVNGATAISRLSSEGLREWLEDYSLGQLWEKNEFGGRPNRA